MKRNVLVLAIAMIGMISFMQVNAQTMVTGGVDSVAVGSQVIYEVTPDANVAAMVSSGALDPSQFDWAIDGSSTATGTINTATNGGVVDLFPASIDLTWNTVGTATVNVAESSVKNDAIVCTDATPSSQPVVVLPVPTYTTDGGNAGACGSQDYNVPLTLTGYGPWVVDYDIEYFDVNGNSVATNSYQKTIGGASNNIGTTSTDFNLPVVGGTELASGTGSYVITITNIDDRFTNKAQNDVNGTVAAAGSSAYTLYVFPTPETSPIQHIQN